MLKYKGQEPWSNSRGPFQLRAPRVGWALIVAAAAVSSPLPKWFPSYPTGLFSRELADKLVARRFSTPDFAAQERDLDLNNCLLHGQMKVFLQHSCIRADGIVFLWDNFSNLLGVASSISHLLMDFYQVQKMGSRETHSGDMFQFIEMIKDNRFSVQLSVAYCSGKT